MAPKTQKSNRKRQSTVEPSTSRGAGARTNQSKEKEKEKAPGSSNEAARLMPLWRNLDSFEKFEDFVYSKCTFDDITDVLQIIYVLVSVVKNMEPTLTSRAIDADPVHGKILEVLRVNNPEKGRQKKFYVKIVDEAGKTHTREDLAQLLAKYVGAE
uniref:Uncharacterized protein n=1 Tax=Tetranychus urticae TaxID=32264 RepID=T1JR33_TETUR